MKQLTAKSDVLQQMLSISQQGVSAQCPSQGGTPPAGSDWCPTEGPLLPTQSPACWNALVPAHGASLQLIFVTMLWDGSDVSLIGLRDA